MTTSTLLRGGLLLGATMTMGLTAGVFALYQHTIMPGLGRLDDRSFIGAYQALDRAIINPWFMLTAFAGALVLSIAATIANAGGSVFAFALAATVLYLVAVIVTLAVNVPLNDAIKAAGAPARLADPELVRAHFHAARWSAFNLVRTLTTTAAFGLLAWSLVLYGRSTG